MGAAGPPLGGGPWVGAQLRSRGCAIGQGGVGAAAGSGSCFCCCSDKASGRAGRAGRAAAPPPHACARAPLVSKARCRAGSSAALGRSRPAYGAQKSTLFTVTRVRSRSPGLQKPPASRLLLPRAAHRRIRAYSSIKIILLPCRFDDITQGTVERPCVCHDCGWRLAAGTWRSAAVGTPCGAPRAPIPT